MAKGRQFFICLSVFLLIGNVASAQELFHLTYFEWPDGCLTYENRGHSDFRGEHRNDNAYVRGLINEFYSIVNQYNAVQYREGQHNAGDYVYLIDKSYGYSSEQYTIYVYSIFQVGGGISSRVVDPDYSPANSSYLLFGYNYAYGLPIGLTIGDSMYWEKIIMYISANLGFSMEPENVEIEWIYGVAISITDWLRIPIGIGGNHFWYKYEEKTYTGYGNYRSETIEEWKHAFVIEAGLQPVIRDFFFLSSTYRLIGFSKSSFTIGAGIIFNKGGK
jgi:hypothetical protein